MKIPLKCDIRSEAEMAQLFGIQVKQLREIARREHFNVAVISAKVRLYDMNDAQRMFREHNIKDS